MDIVTLAAAKSYTNSQIAGITQFNYQVVETLPNVGTKGVIYLVPQEDERHKEYIYINNEFEELGYVDPYVLPTASADTLGGVKIGNFLSNDNGKISADIQFVDSDTEASETVYGKHRISTDANDAVIIQKCTRVALEGEEDIYTYQWETLSYPSSAPDFVYQCTGTADDTAIESLLNTFFAGSDTSFRLDIIGDFGGDGAVSITTSSTARKTVYLDFSGCSINDQAFAVSIPSNIRLYIMNLSGDSVIFSISSGYVYFNNCCLINAQTTGDQPIINVTGGYVYLDNCRLQRATYIWDTSRKCLVNNSYCYISESLISCIETGANSYTFISDSLISEISSSIAHIINKGFMGISNCRVLSGLYSEGVLLIDNTVIDNGGRPVFEFEPANMGKVCISNSTLRGGGWTYANESTVTNVDLKLINCTIYAGMRICCKNASAKICISGCTVEGTNLTGNYNTTAGGLQLGTDNNTIPKFYISGNTFNTTGITVGGSEVTYVTSDNGHYMPEFANKFAEATT